ncbi:MAG TPA: cell division protein FtsA [Gammaproteobacteria bacterium]|jgi:cell division protein FtsA|nr:cell division protein FtsA [Gammaproteobacteria bacterium]
MADSNFIVSVDIGSRKIVVLLADEENGKFTVTGHAIGDSAGVKKGVIVDADQASQAIKKVAEVACLSCDIKSIFNVSTNISDPHLTVINRDGHTFLPTNEVSEGNVKSAIKNACGIPTPTNKQVISSVINHFILDKDSATHQGVVTKYPVGQTATNLEVNMHIVTVSNQCVSAIEQSINGSGFGLNNIVLNSMASSEAYITQDEKDNGVCLVDIGAGVTNLSVFTKGGITYSAVIQKGGDQITEDIAYAFDTSFEEAERLKLEYGDAQVKSIREDKLVPFQQINDDDDPDQSEHYLSQQSLVEVIEQSYSTIFSSIKKVLQSQQLDRSLKSGFVLAGGGAKIKGCDMLMLSCVTVRTKLGCINVDKITTKKLQFEDSLKDPAYACALGLLLFEPNESDFNFRGKQTNKQTSILSKIRDHLSTKL